MLFKTDYNISRPIIGGLALLILFAMAGMRYERSLASAPQATRVEIDVLPGEASKFIDATTRSTVPVAILSSVDFDATTVSPTSVRLAGAPITKGKGLQLARGVLSDVNGDGRIDLTVYVSVYSLHLAAGKSDALLTAVTFDGKSVSGSQEVSFNPPVIQKQPPPKTAPESGTFTNYAECGHPVGTPCDIIINDATQGVPPNPPTPGQAFRYPSSIDVAGQGAVTNLTVTISNYSHTFPDDTDVLLVGPTGATCLLMSDCGGDNAISSATPINLTFDDSAPSSLPDNPPTDPIATGTYKPTRGTPTFGSCAMPMGDYCVPTDFPSPAPLSPYGTTLSVFNGTNPNGTWKLYVIDDSPGDTGDITNGWSLTISAPPPCPGSILPGSQSFSAAAGMGSFSVTADAGCNWPATSNAPWLHVTSGGGPGNGTVNYTVDANAGSTIRSSTISAGFLSFTVYQGINFLDVPSSDPFYDDIGKLSARGITLGCGSGNYCPNAPVTREQMAAFIIRSKGEFDPPTPESQRFNDVPPANVFYAFIDRMAALQITLGCQVSPPLYCPSAPVTREQMAAFIIRGLGEFDPPTPASQRFNDVPPANPFYNFIDRMAVLNITLGCQASPPLYCPSASVTRNQMAAFLVRAFTL
jgi:subtilisin-like proprotein convertase family protein